MEISRMDSLCEEILSTKNQIAILEDKIEDLKNSIRGKMKDVENYFTEVNRSTPYVSPHGTLYLRSDVALLQPRGSALKEVFDHFSQLYGEEIAWEKMSIHNQTLKSAYKEHMESVIERGGDPILEPFPGVPTPKTIKQLIFKRGK